MPSVLLVGSKIRRRSSAALVGEMPVTSRRPARPRADPQATGRRRRPWGRLPRPIAGEAGMYRAGPQPSFKLLAEEVRASLAGFVRGKKGLACLRHKATAAESAR